MQLMFYGCCHPTQDQIHLCLPCDRHTVQESLLGGTQRYSFTASYTDNEITYANPLVLANLGSKSSPTQSYDEPLNDESSI
ncbi:hypothetical protein BaRGS_00037963 [Batillaria attramentaria]|uniref:Uncharacterized protein n=1 Tax=Batillaria attramentaria TaxID=370345 RepID=A0ABD0J7F8_9CAEN